MILYREKTPTRAMRALVKRDVNQFNKPDQDEDLISIEEGSVIFIFVTKRLAMF